MSVPTKSDKIKADQKAWKAGVAAIAKYKLITVEEKAAMTTKYDAQFKAMLDAEKAKAKAKVKKTK
ncbi:MAG: hypothetical protein ACFFEF_02455 [Candidatus Thorarchaeota archaeon]